MNFQIEDYLEDKQKRNNTKNDAGLCRKCKANVLWRRDKVENHIAACSQTGSAVKELFKNAKKKRKLPQTPSFTSEETSSPMSSVNRSDSVSCPGTQTKLTTFYRTITPELAADIDSKVN
jgi:hypothetical protein